MGLSACELPSEALKASGRLGPEEREILTQLYNGLVEKFPGSAAARRIPLTFLEGEELRTALGEHLFVSEEGLPPSFLPSEFSDLPSVDCSLAYSSTPESV